MKKLILKWLGLDQLPELKKTITELIEFFAVKTRNSFNDVIYLIEKRRKEITTLNQKVFDLERKILKLEEQNK